MYNRLAVCVAAIFALVCLPARVLSVDAAPQTSQATSPCSAGWAAKVVEPPNVEVWKLPIDAAGEHELILSVHRDGFKYCYRYAVNGVMQNAAPVIRVRRGERFALRVVNDIAGPSNGESVPSSSIASCMPMAMPPSRTIRYSGYLNHPVLDRPMRPPPADTNVHLHGFQGPAAQENIFVSTLSTPMHACEYHITIPRTQPVGTYFYHPHMHGASYPQVAGGLSGAWIVEPDVPAIARSSQHVIVLRYGIPVRLDNMFQPAGDAIVDAAAAHAAALKTAMPVRYNPFAPPPWPVTFPMTAGDEATPADACDGTGSEALVNVDGAATPAALDLSAGQSLLRIVNGTSDSPKMLQLRDDSGRVVPLRIVAFDGVPVGGDSSRPLAQYVSMPKAMLAPSGRIDVLLTLPQGQSMTLSSEHFCEGDDAFFQMHHDLLHLHAVASSAQPSPVESSPVRSADTPAAKLLAFARAHPAVIRRRAMTFTEYMFPKVGKTPAHLAFYITDTTNPRFSEHPFWPVYQNGSNVPANPDVIVKAGTIEEWYLINTTMESHTFHIHQMSLVQENPAGMPLTGDVAFLPVGKLEPNRGDPNYPLVRPSITKVLLDFRHVPRGTFVFHCHMLFHEDHGMMGIVRVE